MRKDFEKYFTQVQLQYNEMLKTLDKVNEEIAKGLVSDEQRANFENYFSIIKANYDRLSYARYLLRLPPKFIQKIQSKKLRAELDKFIQENADETAVLEENKEALDNINNEVSEEECKNS